MMHKILFLLVSSLCLLGCSSLTRMHTSVITWQENFDQKDHFDTTRWSKIPRGRSDWNRYMSDFDSGYAMRSGKLILRGMVNSDRLTDTARFLTGGIYTKDKMNFGFGRLEIRAKLNPATGAWPAFWMLAQNEKYPGGGEIDIMEHLNDDSIVYQTVHSYYTITLNIKNNPKQGSTALIHPDGFNIYAVEKYPDSLVFFVNNRKTFTYPRIKTDKEQQFPFSEARHYLLLDMQLGGSWVGKVDPKGLPVEMEIDWVRYYDFNGKKGRGLEPAAKTR